MMITFLFCLRRSGMHTHRKNVERENEQRMVERKKWREKGETRSNYLNDVKFVL